MSPPALIDNEWLTFSILPGENINPNPNPSLTPDFLVKKAALHNQMIVSPAVKDESFRMVLPMAMSPPRDNAVPLPLLPESMLSPKTPKRNHLYQEEEFKCNAFCLSLPGFGKQKPLRSPTKSEVDSINKKIIKSSSSSLSSNSTISSLRASLEKFECGSWAASSSRTSLAKESGRFYFDPPIEMIKCGGGDVQEPVSSGFFFHKKTGGLKTRSSLSEIQQRDSSSDTSPKCSVRSSTASSVSCPNSPRSCITPRLLKARDDFNSFLTAQNV